MIRKVVIRRFKRFEEIELDLSGHLVLAGPNNCGKTTILQAIATWDLALRIWREIYELEKGEDGYAWAPIARPNFTAVPLRDFTLLWNETDHGAPIEIELWGEAGWKLAMQVRWDTREQAYVRPRADAEFEVLKNLRCPVAFVPPVSGILLDEGLWGRRERIDAILSQGRSGDVLRNLLVEAADSPSAWKGLTEAVEHHFGVTLLPPVVAASILVQYSDVGTGKTYDISSAGSGFLQVVLLLTILHIRPKTILLLDEPDAHLHVILQDTVYAELKSLAGQQDSLLVVATHSEVVINSVPVEDLWHLLDRPRRVESRQQRELVSASMARLTQSDIVTARVAPGILYVEDFTDLEILAEFARVLGHPAFAVLTSDPFWKPVTWQPRPDAKGISARDHFAALKLVKPELRGLELTDGDGDPRPTETPVTGEGFQRIRWRRYEIESYLLHPEALARFAAMEVGPGQAAESRRAIYAHFEQSYPPPFVKNPFRDEPFLARTKARTELLPPTLTAAGLPAFPYTRFREIAAVMRAEEIHPEIREKLSLICTALGVRA